MYKLEDFGVLRTTNGYLGIFYDAIYCYPDLKVNDEVKDLLILAKKEQRKGFYTGRVLLHKISLLRFYLHHKFAIIKSIILKNKAFKDDAYNCWLDNGKSIGMMEAYIINKRKK